jgi:hypothetical protein
MLIASIYNSGPVPSRSFRVIRHIMMRRFRALLLLGALLATPGSILATTAFPFSQCCCCGSGAMCPMHHTQEPSQKKDDCPDRDRSNQ